MGRNLRRWRRPAAIMAQQPPRARGPGAWALYGPVSALLGGGDSPAASRSSCPYLPAAASQGFSGGGTCSAFPSALNRGRPEKGPEQGPRELPHQGIRKARCPLFPLPSEAAGLVDGAVDVVGLLPPGGAAAVQDA